MISRVKQFSLGFALVIATSRPALVAANGVQPPRTALAVDVTCTRQGSTVALANARVEGVEPGKRTGAIRVLVSPGATPELIPLESIRSLRLERPRKVNAKGFAAARLRRLGDDADVLVRVQVRAGAGPVRLVSYGGTATAEFASCDEITVVLRPDASVQSRSNVPKH